MNILFVYKMIISVIYVLVQIIIMSEKRVIYFDCFSGISGDMILGALADVGVNLKAIRNELEGLGVKGYKFSPLLILLLHTFSS